MGIFWSIIAYLWRPKTRFKFSENWPKSSIGNRLTSGINETNGKLNEKMGIEGDGVKCLFLKNNLKVDFSIYKEAVYTTKRPVIYSGLRRKCDFAILKELP